MTSKLNSALEQIDTINEKDPNQEIYLGTTYPKELLYGKRMSSTLGNFKEAPSELLQIAARGQHVKRWAIPRTDYPMNRKGYLKWRTVLKMFHCDLIEDIMLDCDYSAKDTAYVKGLLMKKDLKSNPDAQTLEDVACLVFLDYYIEEFAATQDNEKMIAILRKTWAKMSEDGHKAAKNLQLSEKITSLVSIAITS